VTIYLTLIGALVVTHAMLRRLTSWRCIIIIIIIIIINDKAVSPNTVIPLRGRSGRVEPAEAYSFRTWRDVKF